MSYQITTTRFGGFFISEIKMNPTNQESPRFPISPVGYRIIVEPIKPEEVSKGGIILATETQQVQEAYTYIGKVVAVGNSCYQHPKFNGEVWCKPGDYVAFGRYTGQKLEIKDDKGGYVNYRIMNDDEILGVINNHEQFRIYL